MWPTSWYSSGIVVVVDVRVVDVVGTPVVVVDSGAPVVVGSSGTASGETDGSVSPTSPSLPTASSGRFGTQLEVDCGTVVSTTPTAASTGAS